MRNRGIGENEVKKRVLEVAEILDLSPFLNKRAAGLAADAKQKISLGRGLVRSDVAAILFDEPLTVIDPHLKWNLRRKLKEVHEQLKLTLIYVTHDQVEALTFADQVMVMYEGELVQTGTPQELFENPKHKFVGYFIGSPGMNFLPCTLDGNIAQIDGAFIELDDETAVLGNKIKGKTGDRHSSHVSGVSRNVRGGRYSDKGQGRGRPGQFQDRYRNPRRPYLTGQTARRPGRAGK